ncbi:peptidylprolyl isomerase [Lunatimonas salinarum]|uniref:peptidylprolyl isomerase n=1 Tax=Lunatimonas salinarum TaxID=1774590 RepID=UPI001FD7AD45|nr:peptidylprolyl isomerase [Lunatimonas salinarum]
MKRRIMGWISACLVVLLGVVGCSGKAVYYVIATELGEIEVELYPKQAPGTVANFVAYAESGAYEKSTFFRVCTPENEADREVKIEVIQGGNVADERLLPAIQLETTEMTGLSHRDGTLSMARSTPHSAQSSFFICVGDQPELDFGGKRNPDGQGFAAFGKVTAGMHVVRTIQHMENQGQYLIDSVRIHRVFRK